MKGHMRLHELLVLIAVFGGIEAFGAIGILVGPMFVAMFVAMLRIYERELSAAVDGGARGAQGPRRRRRRQGRRRLAARWESAASAPRLMR